MVTVDPPSRLGAATGVKLPLAVTVMVEEKKELEAAPGALAKVTPTLELTACGSFTVMVDKTCVGGVPPAINPWLLAAPGALAGIWIADGSLIVIVDAIEGRGGLAATIPWPGVPVEVATAGSIAAVTCGSLMVTVDTA